MITTVIEAHTALGHLGRVQVVPLPVNLVDYVLLVAVDVDDTLLRRLLVGMVVVIIFSSSFSDSSIQTAKWFLIALRALYSVIQALLASLQSVVFL